MLCNSKIFDLSDAQYALYQSKLVPTIPQEEWLRKAHSLAKRIIRQENTKVFKKHRKKLIDTIKEWIESDQMYTCRFGLRMLMIHYLDDDFLSEYLEIPASIRSKDYYVQIMIAWYFATALAKQWEPLFHY